MNSTKKGENMDKEKVYMVRGKPDAEKTYGVDDTFFPLLKYLKKEHPFRIWAATPSKDLVKTLELHNFNVGTAKEEFLQAKPPFENFDILIANATTTMRDKFVEKCFSYSKPFAILLPLASLISGKAYELFKKYGISIIALDASINLTGRKGKGVPAAWFVWGVFSGNQIIFESMGK